MGESFRAGGNQDYFAGRRKTICLDWSVLTTLGRKGKKGARAWGINF